MTEATAIKSTSDIADKMLVIDVKNIVERMKRGEVLTRDERQALTRYTKKQKIQSQRLASAKRSKDISNQEREIGPCPNDVDVARRDGCERDFRLFCNTYMPATFFMDWSPDHIVVIDHIQRAVLDGGLFAMAMPRGSGKTSMVEAAVIWAMLYGHRRFISVVGSDENSALMILDSIKTELEANDLLFQDFPRVCHPIRELDGIPHRCNGQILDGKRTHIQWQDKTLGLPQVDGSPASGGLVKTAGITGRIRGMKHKLQDGKTVRPDFVVVDDPQTDESARSPSQSMTREAVVAGAILGLAGPGKKIAGIMPCTVIHPGDMADRILNRENHPEWQGERMQLVYRWPTNTKLWDQYAELRRESQRKGGTGTEATEFYRANQDAMDAGSRVAWDHRKNPDEISALQHAMNLRIDRGEAVMASEYQNEPLRLNQSTAEPIDTTRVLENRNGLKDGVVPASADHLVSFIDVQQQIVFWAVVAWSKAFGGSVVDYGAFPEQKIAYFTLHDLRHTFATTYRGKSIDAALYEGITACVNQLNREWKREDGVVMRLDRVGIDSGYKSDIVYQLARSHTAANIISPTKGFALKSGGEPMSEWKRFKGEVIGDNWRYRSVTSNRAVRHIIFDTNYWKSFLRTRLNTSIADPGALTFFSGNSHRMMLDQLASETPTETFGRGRRVEEWRLRHGGMDNHWLDCLVGCCMLGSVVGCKLQVSNVPANPAKPNNQRRRERVRYL